MQTLRIGPWKVVPSQNLIEREGESSKLEPRAMDLLMYLAKSRDRVVSAEELLRDVWQGRVFDDGVIYKKVTQLRKALGDDPQQPAYIQTIPKRGYRLIAHVAPLEDGSDGTADHAIEPFNATARNPNGAGANAAPTARLRSGGFGLFILIGAAALLVGAAALTWVDRQRPRVDQPLHVAALPFERDGSESLFVIGGAVWKPDGTAIAFATMDRNAPGPPELNVLYLDQPLPQRLRPRVIGGAKAWTPAGDLIVGTSRGPTVESGAEALWSVPAVGGNPVKLRDMPDGTTNTVVVSSDGSTVAALRRDEQGVFGVWTGPTSGGELERYEPAPFAASSFINVPTIAFSPNGRRLLLMWNPTPSAGAGSEQAWLLPYPADPANPPRRVLDRLPRVVTPSFSWLSDNRHIVLATNTGTGLGRLYFADVDSGNFRPATDGASATSQVFPVVSPDSTRLVFTEVNPNVDIVSMDVRTGTVAPVLATTRIEEMPAWSASKGAFVYVVDRNGERSIWLHEQDGTDRSLVTGADFARGKTLAFLAPQLSPDGARLIYARVGRDPGSAAVDAYLWMSSVSGGAPIRLTDAVDLELPGSWSPDGDWYVYADVSPDGRRQLRKTRTSGHLGPVTLASWMPENVPVWSPRGDWILFDDGELKLIAADGSETRNLGVKDAVCAFALAGDLLHCIQNVDNARSLLAIDFDGGTRRIAAVRPEHVPVATGQPGIRLSLTPDGHAVTYAVDSTQVKLMLADGLANVELP